MDFIGGEARGGANRVVIGSVRHGEDGRPSRFGVRYRPWLAFKP